MKRTVQNSRLTFGDGSVSVQSMTNLPVTDVEGTCEQIRRLASAGCDVVRIALPNAQSVASFRRVREEFPAIPLVADVHFNSDLAVAAMQAGADKVRINPGNMSEESLERVVRCAKERDVIIRVGVNGGSVGKEAIKRYGGKTQALYGMLERYVRFFEERDFFKLVLSVKSSDVAETVEVNRQAAKLGYPMHVGLTEAGPLRQGIIKNAMALGALLTQGIGDTVRVSLTAHPVEEVKAALDILRALHLRGGVTFVSCPQCGRCTIDLEKVACRVYEHVKDCSKNIKIAVMGCEVNGPGECADADIGIAGAGGNYVFFRQGKKYKVAQGEDAVRQFLEEIDRLIQC